MKACQAGFAVKFFTAANLATELSEALQIRLKKLRLVLARHLLERWRKKMKSKYKRDKPLLKAIGSIVLAVIASSHHWLHTLLIALGLTSLGAGLISLSPFVKVMFLLFSLAVSLLFLRVSKKNGIVTEVLHGCI
jgi:hypothetical protein